MTTLLVYVTIPTFTTANVGACRRGLVACIGATCIISNAAVDIPSRCMATLRGVFSAISLARSRCGRVGNVLSRTLRCYGTGGLIGLSSVARGGTAGTLLTCTGGTLNIMNCDMATSNSLTSTSRNLLAVLSSRNGMITGLRPTIACDGNNRNNAVTGANTSFASTTFYNLTTMTILSTTNMTIGGFHGSSSS